MFRASWPVCALCQRQVERMDVSHNVETNMVEMLVECHGQKEFFSLEIKDLAKPNENRMRAFMQVDKLVEDDVRLRVPASFCLERRSIEQALVESVANNYQKTENEMRKLTEWAIIEKWPKR